MKFLVYHKMSPVVRMIRAIVKLLIAVAVVSLVVLMIRALFSSGDQSSEEQDSGSATPETETSQPSNEVPRNNVSAPSTINLSPKTPPTTDFCYRYAQYPVMRTLFYKPPSGGNCNRADWSFHDPNLNHAGGTVKMFDGEGPRPPNTEKFCYKYDPNPHRTFFYKSDDCVSNKWGWGTPLNNYGIGSPNGGSVYAYTSPQPNTTKMCYRYADNPARTLFYKPPDGTDCSPKWGWGFTHPAGSGGELWVPN